MTALHRVLRRPCTVHVAPQNYLAHSATKVSRMSEFVTCAYYCRNRGTSRGYAAVTARHQQHLNSRTGTSPFESNTFLFKNQMTAPLVR